MAHRLPDYYTDQLTATEIQKVKISYTPAPFPSDKYYGSKLSVYGTRNKIRGADK